MKAIEQALTGYLGYDFGTYSYVSKKILVSDKKIANWIRLRRTFWGIILLLISLAWLFLSFV
jgi:hypothetical protein